MAVVPSYWVGVDQSCVGLDLVAEIVECLEVGFNMDGSKVGLLEVGLTLVDIVGRHCLQSNQMLSYVDVTFKLIG